MKINKYSFTTMVEMTLEPCGKHPAQSFTIKFHELAGA